MGREFSRKYICIADLIDAARDIETGVGSGTGDTGSGGYTDHVWVIGVGKGMTVTPAKGDTSKTLFLLNAGFRYPEGNYYPVGAYSLFFSSTQSSASDAWRISFYSSHTSGNMGLDTKNYAFSLRCVRS